MENAQEVAAANGQLESVMQEVVQVITANEKQAEQNQQAAMQNTTNGNGAPAAEPSTSSRRVTRSQTTSRPAVPSASSLKRNLDARAAGDETDVENEEELPQHPQKLAKVEPTVLISAESSSATIATTEAPELMRGVTPPLHAVGVPPTGEYTFLDSSAASFTTERRGPRIRTAPPVPVPNLTKKSRGRRVPTASQSGEIAIPEEAPAVTPTKTSRGYVCQVEECGKCFSRGEHLKRHIRSIHTHEKPFKCTHPSCDKRFNRHDNLLQHLRVHKGDNSSQTSVDSANNDNADDVQEPPTSAEPRASRRTTPTASAAPKRGSRLSVRKTKSAASTPPITMPRNSARTASRSAAGLGLSRTYSLPPPTDFQGPYGGPNGHVASSLRSSFDDSDGPNAPKSSGLSMASVVFAAAERAKEMRREMEYGARTPLYEPREPANGEEPETSSSRSEPVVDPALTGASALYATVRNMVEGQEGGRYSPASFSIR